ncbi:FtsX-like permease family protein [Nonomuraea sp. NPDC048916]|uniref:FtsX-like permease family protein n=1 Tax=Nonomuraea sp. NPDC048916 TaxID=3154232 RepID=UPI0033DF4DD8
MRILPLARVHLGTVTVLALLTLSACLLVAGLPRLVQGSFDGALRESLRGAGAEQVDLTVQVMTRSREEDLVRRDQFGSRDEEFRALLPPPLRPVVLPAGTSTGHASAKTYDTPVRGSGGMRFVNLGWLSDADRRVRWIDGRAPGAPSTMAYEKATIPVFEVGIVEEARAKMGLRLGDVEIIGESNPAAVKIVGVFAANDPADRYWSHHGDVLHVTETQPPGKLDPERRTTALIPDSGLAVLSGADRNLFYGWVLPVAPEAFTSLEVPEVNAAITAFGRGVTLQSASAFSQTRLETGLPELLTGFLAAMATARTVMFLVLGGLLVVALGVIVLAVQLLVERMDHALALARARGGSLRQVAGAGAALVALVVGPAALAGYALSYLVPGPVLWIVHAGPALVVVTAAGFAAARLALTHRAPLHERRDDVVFARPSARRITLEVLVVVLALAGAYLLRSRSLTARGAGDDPFLLFVPIALTVAAALITIRCYPYPLRLLVRLAARRRPAVPFLGLTRAARARSGSVLPVLILLPALGVSVFASVISGGITDTQRLAAWQNAGAPIRLTSAVELPADAVERVRRVPGVELVVPAQTSQVQLGYGGERAEAVAVDLEGWRRVLSGAPISVPALPGTPSGVTALVSPDLRGRGTLDVGWQARIQVTEGGVIASVPGFFSRGPFLVLPFEVNRRPSVNALLIKGDADPAAVLRASGSPRATVATQAGELTAIESGPLTTTVRDVLLVTTIALAAYALVAVVVTLVIGAAERARALSFLRTLGLSDRQAQRLTVLEVLPMILITALVGLALGLGLPAALGPGVDLSSYAGGVSVGHFDPDLVTPALLAAGLATAAVLGAYVHTAISRRRALGATLRVGEVA